MHRYIDIHTGNWPQKQIHPEDIFLYLSRGITFVSVKFYLVRASYLFPCYSRTRQNCLLSPSSCYYFCLFVAPQELGLVGQTKGAWSKKQKDIYLVLLGNFKKGRGHVWALLKHH